MSHKSHIGQKEMPGMTYLTLMTCVTFRICKNKALPLAVMAIIFAKIFFNGL
jgi:hypothetical protein